MRAALPGAVIFLLALAAGLLFARRTLDSYDATIMFTVAKSMVTTHTTYVPPEADPFHISSPHGSFGLGMSLLMAPAYLLAEWLGRDPQAFAMLVNPGLFALVALTIWGWARSTGATPQLAAAVALVTGFGTLLFAYVPTGFSELGVGLGVALCLLGVELARRSSWGALVAGFGTGLTVVMRPDSAILVAPAVCLAIVLQTRSWRSLLTYAISAAPCAMAAAAYSSSGGFHYQGLRLGQGFNHSLLAGIYGLSVSPGRGLLLYVPLVVLAAAGFTWAWRRSPVMAGLCVMLLVSRIVFYAGWFAWMGGWAWGPRFLVPAMPALAPMALEILRRLHLRHPLTHVAVPIITLSVAVQFLGAVVRYDTDSDNLTMTTSVTFAPDKSYMQVATSDSALTAEDRVMFDWRYFPITEHTLKLTKHQDLVNARLVKLLGGT